MTGRDAQGVGLIGHTGFVGSNIDAPHRFTHRYNSRNAGEMAGRDFALLVCAGVYAVKWRANREPDEDRRQIEALMAVLDTVTARRFVLISTIDVYPDPSSGWDETARLDDLPNHPYGRHRLALERWVGERFPGSVVVRLPALFGPGLKKNALFDLMHDNLVGQINPDARFQWYPVARLWNDLWRIEAAGIPLVNLFTEPVGMRDIVDRLFPGAPIGPPAQPAPDYCLRTVHAGLFGGGEGYVLRAPAVLEEMARFIAAEGARR